jgi:hypothetical protein
MESEIIRLASTQGIWTVLSVVLLFYIIRGQEKKDQKQEEREAIYQDLLQKLIEHFNMIQGIEKDISVIKKYLTG